MYIGNFVGLNCYRFSLARLKIINVQFAEDKTEPKYCCPKPNSGATASSELLWAWFIANFGQHFMPGSTLTGSRPHQNWRLSSAAIGAVLTNIWFLCKIFNIQCTLYNIVMKKWDWFYLHQKEVNIVPKQAKNHWTLQKPLPKLRRLLLCTY